MRDPSQRNEEDDSNEEDEEELEDDDEDDEDGDDQEGFMSMLQNFLMSKLDLGGHEEVEKVSHKAYFSTSCVKVFFVIIIKSFH